MTTATQTKCACGTCSCVVAPDATIVKDGKTYCSEACANGHPNGKGCGHTGCDCNAA